METYRAGVPSRCYSLVILLVSRFGCPADVVGPRAVRLAGLPLVAGVVWADRIPLTSQRGITAAERRNGRASVTERQATGRPLIASAADAIREKRWERRLRGT